MNEGFFFHLSVSFLKISTYVLFNYMYFHGFLNKNSLGKPILPILFAT